MVSQSFALYSVDLPAGTLLGDVEVAFTNDAVRNGFDRNLSVDWVEFGGSRFETSASSTSSTGTWNSGTGCAASSVTVSETLHCNGAFTYAPSSTAPTTTAVPPTTAAPTTTTVAPTTTTVPPTTTTVAPTTTTSVAPGGVVPFVVRARGVSGEELLSVRVGGVVVDSFVVSSSFALYSVDLPAGTLLGDVEVAFTNDAVRGGFDRNLSVDWAEFGGSRIETSASSTSSTGTWNSGTGCAASSVTVSETLHCNGAFRYQ